MMATAHRVRSTAAPPAASLVRDVGAGPEQLFTVALNGGDLVALTAGSGLAGAWSPAWSPDGQQVCFTAHFDTYSHLYLINHDGSGLQQLTDGEEDDDFPAWSPGSRWLVFARLFSEPSGLHVVSVAGGDVRFLGPGHDPDWSPVSGQLAFTHADSLWVMAISAEGEGSSAARPLTRAIGFVDSSPSWAPDGRHLVFARETPQEGASTHRLLVMDTESGDCWDLGEGQDPDWGPSLASQLTDRQ
jgi:TolB protein